MIRHVPKTIIKNLEQIRRQFFGGEFDQGEGTKKKLHSMRWDLVCISKEKGGLNLVKVELKNLVL